MKKIELDNHPNVAIGVTDNNTIIQLKLDNATFDFQIKQITHRAWVELEAHLTLATDSKIKELELYIASVGDQYKSTPLGHVIFETNKSSVRAMKSKQSREPAEHTGRRGPVSFFRANILHHTKHKRPRTGRSNKLSARRRGLVRGGRL